MLHSLSFLTAIWYPGNSSKDSLGDTFVFWTFNKSCYSYGLMLQKCAWLVQETSRIRPYMMAAQILDWLSKHLWAFFIAAHDEHDFSFSPDRQCSCKGVEIVVSLSFPLAHISSFFFLYGITSTVYFKCCSYLNLLHVLGSFCRWQMWSLDLEPGFFKMCRSCVGCLKIYWA